MNKIILANNNIEYSLDEKIDHALEKDIVDKLKLKIKRNTKLEITIKNSFETKFEIQIELAKNVTLDLTEIKKGEKSKFSKKITLKENSVLHLIEINDIETINERTIIYLNGEGSKVDTILKTVSKNTEKYDFSIHHNANKTQSDIITNGVNIDGNLYFTITTFIPKGKKDCLANQNNRIINLVEKDCVIRPNLLIDEVDVTANHSALIGSFKDEELFYIERLGIQKEIATKLLIEGFIKNKLSNKLANHFKKYWR